MSWGRDELLRSTASARPFAALAVRLAPEPLFPEVQTPGVEKYLLRVVVRRPEDNSSRWRIRPGQTALGMPIWRSHQLGRLMTPGAELAKYVQLWMIWASREVL